MPDVETTRTPSPTENLWRSTGLGSRGLMIDMVVGAVFAVTDLRRRAAAAAISSRRRAGSNSFFFAGFFAAIFFTAASFAGLFEFAGAFEIFGLGFADAAAALDFGAVVAFAAEGFLTAGFLAAGFSATGFLATTAARAFLAADLAGFAASRLAVVLAAGFLVAAVFLAVIIVSITEPGRQGGLRSAIEGGLTRG